MSQQLPIIKIPKFITRSFIASHREYIFVFGSDVHQQSFVGQSAQARGESNAFGVATKYRCCMQSNSFFYDDSLKNVVGGLIDTSISFIPRDGRPIILFPRIGQGCAELGVRSNTSKVLAYIQSELGKIAYKNVEYIDYAP